MKHKMIAVLLALTLSIGMTVSPSLVLADETSMDSTPVGVPAEGEAMLAAVTCPVNMEPSVENTYPYMGISIKLPPILLNAVLDNKVFMRVDEKVEYTDLNGSNRVPMDWRPAPECTILHGGGVELLFVPEEQQERTPHFGMDEPMLYDEYEIWAQDTIPLAHIGMYLKSEFDDSVLPQGYAYHVQLGENAQYVYCLSYNKATDQMTPEAKEFFAAVNELKDGVSVFEAKPVDDHYFGLTTPDVKQVSQVGEFHAQTLNGEIMDQTSFSAKKLTMINVWTTWCGACIEEMPELEKLSQELKDTDAQLMSIVCDTADARGEIDAELLELAQLIVKRTGVTFPSLIPDVSLKEELLQGVLGYPTTWFVDEQGHIVGDPVLGSRSAEEWMALVQERLEEVHP